MNKLIKTFYTISVLFLCISCKTAEFGVKCIDINGMVYDFENRPVAGYAISVGPRLHSVTDITGRFTIQKVPVGIYIINGNRENYESYTGELVLSDKKQIVYIRVPSATQLLDLADKSLADNRIAEAAIYVERAEMTGLQSTESVFYKAVVLFRKGDFKGAEDLLEKLVSSGVDDIYVRNFLADMKGKKDDVND